MVRLVIAAAIGVGALAGALDGMPARAAEWEGGLPGLSRVQYYPQRGYDERRDDRRSDDRRDDRGYGPGGTYQQSCRGIRQDGPTLTAVCSDGRGREVQSSIDVGRCRGADIANNRGVLQCGGVRGR